MTDRKKNGLIEDVLPIPQILAAISNIGEQAAVNFSTNSTPEDVVDKTKLAALTSIHRNFERLYKSDSDVSACDISMEVRQKYFLEATAYVGNSLSYPGWKLGYFRSEAIKGGPVDKEEKEFFSTTFLALDKFWYSVQEAINLHFKK